jgi:predicted chitinase
VQVTVQAGDNLSAIAQRFGTTVEELQRLNSIQNPNQIFAGQSLEVPETGTSQPPQEAGPDGEVGAVGNLKMNFDHKTLLEVYTNPGIDVPDIQPWVCQEYAPHLVAAFLKHGYNNRRQVAHWLAQSGYETGCFNWLEEFSGRFLAAELGYGGGEDFYGRGTAMTTHDSNYAEVGNLMGLPDLTHQPWVIGCVNDDPTEWPRDTALCMESGVAFARLRGIRDMANTGDDAFDQIMATWLGTADHPSYWRRFALYRAMIDKLPRPLFVEV